MSGQAVFCVFFKAPGVIFKRYLTHVCMCVRSCACICADLARPLARLLVERLGSCQNGLIDRLVGGHHQQFWLIVILTISKLIFIIYLPLLYCLLILRLGRAGGIVGGGWRSRKDWVGLGGKGREAKKGRKIRKNVERGSREWPEGRKHGKRRHLVQYERHWMNEEQDKSFTGGRSE